MKVVIANWSKPGREADDITSFWAQHQKPPGRKSRRSLFEFAVDWGFHIFALGIYLMDRGEAQEVEFWDRSPTRSMAYHPSGVLEIAFLNEHDVKGYLDRYGYPDLFINHGQAGNILLPLLEGKCFRVHVPALRSGQVHKKNFGAECYLVDSVEFLDDHSMLYIPVVNTEKIRPLDREKKRDFIYLANVRGGKRHDILLNAVRGRSLTGHLHPVDASQLDLSNTRITTSDWDENDVLELLTTSKIAVCPGDYTSSPAAMWECVAAGLPIVVNEQIKGGKHVVVPGVTGELATEDTFYDVMKHVLSNLDVYRPREYFEKHWDTLTWLEQYLSFFCEMGWNRTKSQNSILGAQNGMEECLGRQATPVSIVIPVYNAEQYLEECIVSLLAQNYPIEEREFLFIDNNSSDRSLSILKKYASKVRILQEPVQGPAAARNQGLKHARHDLIAFIDADCTADKDWLWNLVKTLTKDSAIGAVGGKILSRRPANAIEGFGEIIHDHDKAINSFTPPYCITMNMAIRRAVLDEVGLFNQEYLRCEDSDLSYRLYNKRAKLRYVPEAIVYHANEKHLLGLFLEGFSHGMWKIKLEREYRDTVLKGRKRSRHADYVEIKKAFFEFISRTIAARKIVPTPLCECLFRLGKKTGNVVGSVRFKSIR